MPQQLMDSTLHVYVPDSGKNINLFLGLCFGSCFQGRAAGDTNPWVILNGFAVFGPGM